MELPEVEKSILSKQPIVKILLVALSSFFWIYFLIASKITLHAIIVFDLISMFNSIGTINFLLFLVFLPLTSVIILAITFNSTKEESLMVVIFGLLLAIIVSTIAFGLNVFFIIFLILYIVAHIILCLIVKRNYEKSWYNQSTEWLSKLAIFLIIAIFLSSAIYLLPNQRQRAEEFEAGIVNLFIADDLDPWVNTSYAISKQCTISNIKYIMTSPEYTALNKETSPVVLDFTNFMDNLRTSALADRSSAEIKDVMPDLDTPVIKTKIVDTIKAIPFMGFIEHNFAFFFSIIFSSLVYSYLSIVFIIFAAFIYLFNKIFKEEK